MDEIFERGLFLKVGSCSSTKPSIGFSAWSFPKKHFFGSTRKDSMLITLRVMSWGSTPFPTTVGQAHWHGTPKTIRSPWLGAMDYACSSRAHKESPGFPGLSWMVEVGGIEPPSEVTFPTALHACRLVEFSPQGLHKAPSTPRSQPLFLFPSTGALENQPI